MSHKAEGTHSHLLVLEAEGQPWHGGVILLEALLVSVTGQEDHLQLARIGHLELVVEVGQRGGEAAAWGAPVGRAVQACTQTAPCWANEDFI